MNDTIYTVIGIKVGRFTPKSGGEEIIYCKVFATYKDDKVTGIACKELSMKPDLADGLITGDDIIVYYNQYGKISNLKVVGQ